MVNFVKIADKLMVNLERSRTSSRGRTSRFVFRQSIATQDSIAWQQNQ